MDIQSAAALLQQRLAGNTSFQVEPLSLESDGIGAAWALTKAGTEGRVWLALHTGPLDNDSATTLADKLFAAGSPAELLLFDLKNQYGYWWKVRKSGTRLSDCVSHTQSLELGYDFATDFQIIAA